MTGTPLQTDLVTLFNEWLGKWNEEDKTNLLDHTRHLNCGWWAKESERHLKAHCDKVTMTENPSSRPTQSSSSVGDWGYEVREIDNFLWPAPSCLLDKGRKEVETPFIEGLPGDPRKLWTSRPPPAHAGGGRVDLERKPAREMGWFLTDTLFLTKLVIDSWGNGVRKINFNSCPASGNFYEFCLNLGSKRHFVIFVCGDVFHVVDITHAL
jgi:hypothetical protein